MRFMWQQWGRQVSSTHTGSGCSQTWGRCRWGRRWGRWPGTRRPAAPAPGRWQWHTECTPSAPPGRNSAWWWWLLRTQTPPVLRVTSCHRAGLDLQRGICTSSVQKEALTARNATVKPDPHWPCNACLGLDQLQFLSLISSHVTWNLFPAALIGSSVWVSCYLMQHRTFSFSLKGLPRFTAVVVQVTESAHSYFEEESHHRRHKWWD